MQAAGELGLEVVAERLEKDKHYRKCMTDYVCDLRCNDLESLLILSVFIAP